MNIEHSTGLFFNRAARSHCAAVEGKSIWCCCIFPQLAGKAQTWTSFPLFAFISTGGTGLKNTLLKVQSARTRQWFDKMLKEKLGDITRNSGKHATRCAWKQEWLATID
ncbi:hypothetical protein [Azohydromonas aeria]|uniref:hypothetical protein n=1 Tax=Azohydromonas aeria TaxID=2590212 RepID=UPI0012F869DE|nr:hypothetical protein [Azohydromonas aeria]